MRKVLESTYDKWNISWSFVTQVFRNGILSPSFLTSFLYLPVEASINIVYNLAPELSQSFQERARTFHAISQRVCINHHFNNIQNICMLIRLCTCTYTSFNETLREKKNFWNAKKNRVGFRSWMLDIHCYVFLVPYCDVHYDFLIKTMFGSSLPLGVYWRVYVLLTLFIFVCFCVLLVFILYRLHTLLSVSLDCQPLIVPFGFL
jgi:hypothetical protein